MGTGPWVLLKPAAIDNSECEADSEDDPDLGTESEVETEAEEVLAC